MNIIALLGGVRATVFAGVAVAALASTTAFWLKSAHLENKLGDIAAATAQAQLDQITKSAEDYRARAEAMAAAGDQYEKQLAQARRTKDSVLAQLRAAQLQLQDYWTCGADPSAPAPGEPDACARLRDEASARIVQIGAEADAHISGLQRVIEEYHRSEREHLPSGSD